MGADLRVCPYTHTRNYPIWRYPDIQRLSSNCI